MKKGRETAEAGFNLVILVVAVTVLNIGVAAALPVWSHLIQREKEAELIFRGLQYAEAIRVCQLPNRLGRLPVRLEELLEAEPRCIRQLYPNPMTEDGRWGLILETGRGARGRNAANPQGGNIPQGEDRRRDTEDDSDFGGRSQPGGLRPDANGDLRTSGAQGEVVQGPIKGVHSIVGGKAIKVFFDQTDYGDWAFTYDLLLGANPGSPLPGGQPRPVTANTLGRPFPPGITPQQTVVPGANPNDPNAVPGPGSPLNPGTGGAQPRPRNPRRSG